MGCNGPQSNALWASFDDTEGRWGHRALSNWERPQAAWRQKPDTWPRSPIRDRCDLPNLRVTLTILVARMTPEMV